MNDMQPNDVAPNCTEQRIRLYDGSERRIFLCDEEVPYPDGKLIVSSTDTEGVITHCNDSFVDMSGYSEAELIGQPHSILRHPDIPKAAFADMWNTVQGGEKWAGYIKNLRKDGRYYWVYATVVPNKRAGVIKGFTSVRRKPSRDRVNEAQALYIEMKKAEVNS